MFPDGCLACGRPIAHASVKNDGASRWLSSLVAHWAEAACPCPLYVMCYDTMQTSCLRLMGEKLRSRQRIHRYHFS
jgi:hypothetical protein